MGFILGTVTIFNYGAGSAGIMRTLGKYMAGSAATFRCARQCEEFQAIVLTCTSQCFHGRRQCHPNRHVACDVRNMGKISIFATSTSKTIPTSPTKRKMISKMRNVHYSLSLSHTLTGRIQQFSAGSMFVSSGVSTFQSNLHGSALRSLLRQYGTCGWSCTAKPPTSMLEKRSSIALHASYVRFPPTTCAVCRALPCASASNFVGALLAWQGSSLEAVRSIQTHPEGCEPDNKRYWQWETAVELFLMIERCAVHFIPDGPQLKKLIIRCYQKTICRTPAAMEMIMLSENLKVDREPLTLIAALILCCIYPRISEAIRSLPT